MGRPKLYHTASEQREARLARKRRYYDRNQERITDKARKKYRERHPPQSKDVSLRAMVAGAEQSELSVQIDRYLEICVKCDDMLTPSETNYAKTLCDLVLLTGDVEACTRALQPLDNLYDELIHTMDRILQIDGVGELWRQCDATLKQLRHAIALVNEVECYASDVGRLKQAFERGDLGFQKL